MENVLVLTTWSYTEGLIQSAVLPYLQIIKEIDPEIHFFLSTSENESAPKSDLNYITLIPFQQNNFGIKKILQLPAQMGKLLSIIKKHKIKIIHAFCTPAGMMGYILSKLSSAMLILDSYEPHAESMVENGTWKKGGPAFNLLFKFEKLQTRTAKHIISCTQEMLKYALEKYQTPILNFYVKPACVDLSLFTIDEKVRSDTRARLNFNDKIVCVYVGKFGGIYQEEEVYAFFKEAQLYWGEQFKVLLLTSEQRELIDQKALAAGFDPSVITSFRASHQEVPAFLNAADFAITPVKPVPSKRFCTPIKDGEYWAAGLPIVIPQRISDDSDIIYTNGIGAVLSSLNSNEYRKALNKVDTLLKGDREKLKIKVRAIAFKYRSYDIARGVYEKVYGDTGKVSENKEIIRP